jgi:hypothetical protein
MAEQLKIHGRITPMEIFVCLTETCLTFEIQAICIEYLRAIVYAGVDAK